MTPIELEQLMEAKNLSESDRDEVRKSAEVFERLGRIRRKEPVGAISPEMREFVGGEAKP